MKIHLRCFFVLLCTTVICMGLTAPSFALDNEEMIAQRASDQLTYYAAYALTAPNGGVTIEFEVEGTGRMDLLGASCIIVQEKVGTSWVGVQTYYASTTDGMLKSNAYLHIGSITYAGTPGKEYRAYATVYAENSTGDDSRTIITNSVTANNF